MIEADPDLLRLQRLLHEGVRRRLRVRVLPELLDRGPHRLGVGALVRRHEPARVRGVEVPLEEPVEQAVRPRGQPDHPLAGLVQDVLAPGDELVVGQRVHVRSGREVLEGLLVDGEEVRRLHPGHVVLRARAELAEAHERRRDPFVLVLVHDLADVLKAGDHAAELAVLEAHEADLAGPAGLGLGGDAVEDDALGVGDVVDRGALVAGEDLRSHGFLLGRWRELGGREHEALARVGGPGTTARGRALRRAGGQHQRDRDGGPTDSHGTSPTRSLRTAGGYT